MDQVRSLYLRHNQARNVNKSQYPAKRISTQRINPSIPLPSIVKHACITASIAAAAANDFQRGRGLTCAGSRSFGFSFMASFPYRVIASHKVAKQSLIPFTST